MTTSSEGISRAAMPRPINNRAQMIALWIGFALFVAGLAAALFLAVSTESVRSNARHHNDVAQATRDLLSALQDSEAGQRGFLLTQDERYLEPYLFSRVSLQAVVRNMSDLVREDPGQAKRLDDIRPLIDAKTAELETTIELARTGRRGEALAIVTGDSGRQMMDDLRARIATFSNYETSALNARRAQLDRNAFLLQTIIVTTIILGFMLVWTVASARTRLMRNLATQNLQLEERVRERTAALEARSKRVENLIQDMSHRIGNSLSLVTGFLDLQARASKSDEVKGALAAARQRVFSIASAQRRMRLAMDTDTVDSAGFFETLIEDFRNALPDDRIHILAEIEPLSVPSQDASAFGVILNELLANAVKHAWAPSDQGALTVKFTREGNAHVLRVSDDGRGSKREDSSGGLGQILVQSLVQSIRGTLEMAPLKSDPERPGLACTVRAPV